MEQKKNIIVIGAGIAGISAAHVLAKRHVVTLYEANDYIGGHTNTIVCKDENKSLAVDTGFIVFNDNNYPNFNAFIKQLGVKSQDSCMSFSFYDEEKPFYYGSLGLASLFAQKRNILNPKFYALILEINRFNEFALSYALDNSKDELTLKDLLIKGQFSNYFTTNYVLPMGAAIWSCSYKEILDFPAKSFVQFWKNHQLLTIGKRPTWKTIQGGSFQYVKAFEKQFKGNIHKNTPIKSIQRSKDGVIVTCQNGNTQKADTIVIATHANQVLRLLENPSDAEKNLFSQWQYSKNTAVLHQDTSFLPPSKKAWASWNYNFGTKEDDKVSVTYYMNHLQKLKTEKPYLVTLNPHKDIDESKILKTISYSHPLFTFESMNSQKAIQDLNGKQNTYYCGSYLGYGFHEDAISSSLKACEGLGVSL